MTETNRRDIVVAFRLTAVQAAHIDAAGQALRHPRSRSDYCRAAALHMAKARVPPPSAPVRRPARRKPTYDTVLLAQILAQIGRVGSNVNQIAKALNSRGPMPSPDHLAAIGSDIAAIRDAVRLALDGSAQSGSQDVSHDHQG